MALRIHRNGGPHQPAQPSPRPAPAPTTSGPASADWVSGNKDLPALRRLKKRQKEKARRQRRGEVKRTMALNNQATGEVQDQPSADNKTQAADLTVSHRTEDSSSSNQVVVVAMAAAAEHNQVVRGAQDESSADNKTQAADPAATRRTENVGSSSQVAAAVKVEVLATAPSSVATVAEPPSASLVTTASEIDNDSQALARLRLGNLLLPLVKNKFRSSRAARTQVSVSVSLAEEVGAAAAATPSIVAVEEPSSSSLSSATRASDVAANQEALARLRLGSFLLPLIKNKFRRSQVAGKKINTEQFAAKAVEEPDDQASSQKSAAEMAEVLKAKAVELEAVAVAARAVSAELDKQVEERDRIGEELYLLVIENLDNRAAILNKKTCEPSTTLDEAERVFVELYTGKAPTERGCVHDGSYDSGSTYKINSYGSTGDKKHSEGSDLEDRQCLPPSAALFPMPVQQVHPGLCLVDVGGTFYPMASLPGQQQQQADQSLAWGEANAAEGQTAMQYVHPQAMAYEESVLGTGMCAGATQQCLPSQALTYDDNFAGMCPSPVLPMHQYDTPLLAYGGDTYLVQMPQGPSLNTVCGGNTEGSMYPLEVPQWRQHSFVNDERFGGFVYSPAPMTYGGRCHVGGTIYNQAPAADEGGCYW